MAFGDRIKARREELALSRPQLADRLGVTPSTVSNYETGVSFPKEEMMLRLFDCLETDPNTLFQDSFRRGADVLTQRERQLLEQYRSLSPLGRESVQTMVEALRACQQESAAPEQEPRVIPLYRTPAAAGYAAPVFGEDFDYLQVTDGVPQAAEFAVRIQGDSMVPYIPDGSVVYVNRDPLKAGDVGIFCVDGDIFCKQYYKDENGDYFFYKKTFGGYYLYNILNEQENTHRESSQTDLKGILNLTVNLYKGLKYNGLFSYASSHSSSSDYAKEKSAYAAEIRGYDFGDYTQEEYDKTSLPFGGVYNETNYEQRTSLIRNSL